MSNIKQMTLNMCCNERGEQTSKQACKQESKSRNSSWNDPKSHTQQKQGHGVIWFQMPATPLIYGQISLSHPCQQIFYIGCDLPRITCIVPQMSPSLQYRISFCLSCCEELGLLKFMCSIYSWRRHMLWRDMNLRKHHGTPIAVGNEQGESCVWLSDSWWSHWLLTDQLGLLKSFL